MPVLESITNGFSATPTDEFLVQARGLIRGARILAGTEDPDAFPAFALVVGQVLELTLKAFIVQRDAAAVSAWKKGGGGHHILQLWSRAAGLGLAVPAAPPDWVNDVHRFHSSPYRSRYAKIESNLTTGFVVPIVRRELDRLFAQVENQLGKH